MLPSVLPLATFFTNFVQISVIVLALNAISNEGQANQASVKKEEESDKIKTSEDSDSLRKHVQKLLKEPSSGARTDNVEAHSNATQPTEKLARVDPALLYFYDKFFPGDVDKAVVNELVSGIIQKSRTVEKKRPVIPLRRNLHTDAPNQTKASDRADKVPLSTRHDEEDEIKKALLLSRLQSILLDANMLLKLQAKSEDWSTSSHKASSQNDGHSKESSIPTLNDGTAQKGSENKAQPAPKLDPTEAAEEKAITPKTEPGRNNNLKSPPAAEKKESDRPPHSKLTVEEKVKREEVEEIDVSSALARERANKDHLKQAQNGRGRAVPKPEAAPHIPAQQPVKQEPKEDKVASGFSPALTPVKPVKVNSSLPKEMKTQGGNENNPHPAAKLDPTKAAKEKIVSAATEPKRNNDPKPPSAAEKKESDRPTRSKLTIVEEKFKRKEVEEVYVSSTHAKEGATTAMSRPEQAQNEQGRMTPKLDAVPPIPPPQQVKQEPKKEDKVASGPNAISAPAPTQPVKVSLSLPKENKIQEGCGNKARPAPKLDPTKAAKEKVASPTAESERNNNPKPPSAAEKKDSYPTRSKHSVVEGKVRQEEVEDIYVSSAHARERADKSRLKQAQNERGRVVPKPDAVPHIPAQQPVKQELKKEEKVVFSQSPAPAPVQPVKANSSSPKEDKYSTKYVPTVETSKPQYASSSKASAGVQPEAKPSAVPIKKETKGFSVSPVTSKPEPRVQPPPQSVPAPKTASTSNSCSHDKYMVVGGTFQCSGITNQHQRCLNRVRSSASYIRGNEPKVFCYWHGVSHGSTIPKSLDPSAREPGRCSAITQRGTLCRRNASHFQPKAQFGYCWQHA